MNALNSILVEGNLVRDPSTKTLPSGSQVCAFTLATNRYFKSGEQGLEEEVSYFDVEAWSRLAATCSQYLKKGRGVRVVGRLKQDRWTDSEGKQKAKVKIVAEHVEFSPRKHGPQAEESAGQEAEEIQEEAEVPAEAAVF
ncbi:MAG TPA: single-stranded DNA-binding protein [Rectinemataceae bacterium]